MYLGISYRIIGLFFLGFLLVILQDFQLSFTQISYEMHLSFFFMYSYIFTQKLLIGFLLEFLIDSIGIYPNSQCVSPNYFKNFLMDCNRCFSRVLLGFPNSFFSIIFVMHPPKNSSGISSENSPIITPSRYFFNNSQ